MNTLAISMTVKGPKHNREMKEWELVNKIKQITKLPNGQFPELIKEERNFLYWKKNQDERNFFAPSIKKIQNEIVKTCLKIKDNTYF